MTTYVDNLKKYKRSIKRGKTEKIPLCRMVSDTPGELYVMARHLEIQHEFIPGIRQKDSLYSIEYFLITEFNRIKAIELGAVEIDNFELDTKVQQLKNYRKMTENTKNALGHET